jgi:acetylornithine aminotransferase
VQPDIITVAKALGNGIPVGACMANQAVGELFQPGRHGSTFGGNPFACRVAETVVQTMLAEQIDSQVRTVGAYLLQQLQAVLTPYQAVKSIRAKGLLIGIELDRPASKLYSIALKHGLLLNITAGNTIRLLPPLIINKTDADEIAKRLQHCLADFLA